jgi:hypothetical protein
LGERRLCTAEVRGSNPLISTKAKEEQDRNKGRNKEERIEKVKKREVEER